MAQPIDIIACLVCPFEFVAEVSAHVGGAITVSDGLTDFVCNLDSVI